MRSAGRSEWIRGYDVWASFKHNRIPESNALRDPVLVRCARCDYSTEATPSMRMTWPAGMSGPDISELMAT
jgi:hypothetical protein